MSILIIREIAKLLMFVTTWGLPLAIAYVFKNNLYLWLFVLSFLVNVGVFSHYEDLGKIENATKDEEDVQENE